MKVKTKIWSVPLVAAVLFGLGVGFSGYAATRALDAIRMVRDIGFPALAISGVMQGQMHDIEQALNNSVGDGDKKGLDAVGSRADAFRDQQKKLAATEGNDGAANRLGSEFESYFSAANGAARLMMGLEKGDAQSAVEKMHESRKILINDLDAIHEAAQSQFSSGVAATEDGIRFILVESISLAVVILVLLAVVSHLVVRAIWSDLGGEPRYARQIAQSIADGNLSVPVERKPGDTTSLLATLDDMKDRLRDMVSGILESAEAIGGATREISSGNADLSSRTDAQASSLSETAASIAELAGTVAKNADSAQQANGLVISTAQIAEKGGDVFTNVVTTMSEIHESARRISDITGLIDGIAFQTNILALNAAVEAARAGEQGRGFAVVANEVRSLAQRSANAAKEIKELISTSSSLVSTGRQLVEDTGTTMNEIVSSVQEVTAIVATIATASAEQSRGLEMVNRAIGEMDEATQCNAAMTEQASAATLSLREQVENLQKAVAVFTL